MATNECKSVTVAPYLVEIVARMVISGVHRQPVKNQETLANSKALADFRDRPDSNSNT